VSALRSLSFESGLVPIAGGRFWCDLKLLRETVRQR
jgi:hypothetical protein